MPSGKPVFHLNSGYYPVSVPLACPSFCKLKTFQISKTVTNKKCICYHINLFTYFQQNTVPNNSSSFFQQPQK